MIFVQWFIIKPICVGLLMIAIAISSVWFVRNKGRSIRLMVRIVSAILGLCGVLYLWTIPWVVSSGHVYSAPVYSPNRKMAARIDSYNSGEIGVFPTHDSVQLFSSHGFSSVVVFYGEWHSLRDSKIQWVSDSELEIYHRAVAGVCNSTARVNVHCIKQAPLAPVRNGTGHSFCYDCFENLGFSPDGASAVTHSPVWPCQRVPRPTRAEFHTPCEERDWQREFQRCAPSAADYCGNVGRISVSLADNAFWK